MIDMFGLYDMLKMDEIVKWDLKFCLEMIFLGFYVFLIIISVGRIIE